MKTLAIVGASGHGKVVADLAELCGFNVTFFDDAFPQLKQVEHWPVKGSFTDLLTQQDCYQYAIVAIGNNAIRSKLSEQLIESGFNLPVLIHPSAIVSQYAHINEGSVVFANAVINAFAQIGENCIINTGAIIEHDCIIANGVHLSPKVSLAGATKVGAATWLGIGSVTKQGIEIGANSIIGANATVLNNIPSNVTVVGSPAVSK